MTENPADLGPRAYTLEKYRTRIGLWQAIWGTILSTGLAVAIPAGVDAYKARLDTEKADLENQLKRMEMEGKRIEAREQYIATFLDRAMNQDIELRLRLSEYFGFLADEEDRGSWQAFNKTLADRRQAIRSEITTNEDELMKVESSPEPPSPAAQEKIAALTRQLDWDYAEVGYVRKDSNVSSPARSASPVTDKPSVIAEDEADFVTTKVSSARVEELDQRAQTITNNRARYESVAAATGIPWFVVGILHQLEASGDFTRHLNGDPLTAKTVHIPVGRPLSGTAPFTWEEAASDYLKLSGLATTPDEYRSVGGTLYRLEMFNGAGYRHRNAVSPYIWSCTDHYASGTYVADGTYNGSAVSKICGAAALLKTLMNSGAVEFQGP